MCSKKWTLMIINSINEINLVSVPFIKLIKKVTFPEKSPITIAKLCLKDKLLMTFHENKMIKFSEIENNFNFISKKLFNHKINMINFSNNNNFIVNSSNWNKPVNIDCFQNFLKTNSILNKKNYVIEYLNKHDFVIPEPEISINQKSNFGTSILSNKSYLKTKDRESRDLLIHELWWN